MAPSHRSGRSARRREERGSSCASRAPRACAVPAVGLRRERRGPRAPRPGRGRPGRVHGEVGLAVVGLARAVKGLDLRRGRLASMGRVASAPRARVQRGEVAGQPHDGAEARGALPAPRGTAARRPVAITSPDLSSRASPPPSRARGMRLASSGRSPGSTGPLGRRSCRRSRRSSGRAGGRAAGPRRLSRAHEAHEDNVVIHRRIPASSRSARPSYRTVHGCVPW